MQMLDSCWRLRFRGILIPRKAKTRRRHNLPFLSWKRKLFKPKQCISPPTFVFCPSGRTNEIIPNCPRQGGGGGQEMDDNGIFQLQWRDLMNVSKIYEHLIGCCAGCAWEKEFTATEELLFYPWLLLCWFPRLETDDFWSVVGCALAGWLGKPKGCNWHENSQTTSQE